MYFIKNLIKKIVKFFCTPQAPIGLKSMGIKLKYFEKINSFNYSKNRFYTEMLSPVNEPFYFKWYKKHVFLERKIHAFL